MQSSIVKWVDKMFVHANEKHWFKTYWCIDIHGTISKPDYRKRTKELLFYPFAKETLQLLSEREDVVLILYTSSYPDEIKIYESIFKGNGIKFDYINENPEISTSNGAFGYYEQKLYFNVLLDDKAGFDPLVDWVELFKYMESTKYRPDKNWTQKVKETYHN